VAIALWLICIPGARQHPVGIPAFGFVFRLKSSTGVLRLPQRE